MIRNMLPNLTLEGDNVVMLLQTARILVSSLQKVSRGKPVPESVQYLEQEPQKLSESFRTKESFFDEKLLVRLWESASSFATRSAAGKLLEGMEVSNNSMKESWDKSAGVALFNAGKMHITSFTLNAMVKGAEKFESKYNKEAFKRLCALFAVNQMLKNASFSTNRRFSQEKRFQSQRKQWKVSWS